MRLSPLLLLALLLVCAMGRSSAFTNGTLLPAYLCGPPTDGLPKSLGGVIPFFVLNTNPQTVTAPPATIAAVDPALGVINGDGNFIRVDRPLDGCMGGSLLNTQKILAGFHSAAILSGATTITPFKKVINVAVVSTVQNAALTNMIVSGYDHNLQLQATPNDLGVFDINTALDGALVYAVDTATGLSRVGEFIATGTNMVTWAACGGPNANAGVIHHQLLSCTGAYDGLVWRAPINMVGQSVTFKGAAVSDNGFGGHTTTYTIESPPLAAPAAPTLNVLVYLPTMSALSIADGGTAALNNLATSFTVTVTDATTGTMLGTPMTTTATTFYFNLDGLVNNANAKGHTIKVAATATNGFAGTTTSGTSNVLQVVGGTFTTGAAP